VCGRATLTKNESELEEKFGATFYSEDIERYNPIPSYNIGPAQPLVYKAQNDQSHLKIGIWGWNIPMGVKTQLVINARLEEIDQKKTFIPYLDYGKCIILIDGYYEWMRLHNEKIPFRITSPDGSILAIAGLFREEINKDGNSVNNVIVMTKPVQDSLQQIHDRMPVILTESEQQNWLNNKIERKIIKNLVNIERITNLQAYRVSSKVNSIKNNNADLILPNETPIYFQENLFD